MTKFCAIFFQWQILAHPLGSGCLSSTTPTTHPPTNHHLFNSILN